MAVAVGVELLAEVVSAFGVGDADELVCISERAGVVLAVTISSPAISNPASGMVVGGENKVDDSPVRAAAVVVRVGVFEVADVEGAAVEVEL